MADSVKRTGPYSKRNARKKANALEKEEYVTGLVRDVMVDFVTLNLNLKYNDTSYDAYVESAISSSKYNYYEKLMLYKIYTHALECRVYPHSADTKLLLFHRAWLTQLRWTRGRNDAVSDMLVALHETNLSAGDYGPVWFACTDELTTDSKRYELGKTSQLITKLAEEGLVIRRSGKFRASSFRWPALEDDMLFKDDSQQDTFQAELEDMSQVVIEHTAPAPTDVYAAIAADVLEYEAEQAAQQRARAVSFGSFKPVACAQAAPAPAKPQGLAWKSVVATPVPQTQQQKGTAAAPVPKTQQQQAAAAAPAAPKAQPQPQQKAPAAAAPLEPMKEGVMPASWSPQFGDKAQGEELSLEKRVTMEAVTVRKDLERVVYRNFDPMRDRSKFRETVNADKELTPYQRLMAIQIWQETSQHAHHQPYGRTVSGKDLQHIMRRRRWVDEFLDLSQPHADTKKMAQLCSEMLHVVALFISIDVINAALQLNISDVEMGRVVAQLQADGLVVVRGIQVLLAVEVREVDAVDKTLWPDMKNMGEHARRAKMSRMYPGTGRGQRV